MQAGHNNKEGHLISVSIYTSTPLTLITLRLETAEKLHSEQVCSCK